MAGNGPFQVSSKSQEYYFTEIFNTFYLQFYNMHEHSMFVLLQHTFKKNHIIWRKKSALNMEQSQNNLGKNIKAHRYFRY